MAAFSARNSVLESFWISAFLLLILLQMVTTLVYFAGVFIISNEVLISPFLFCQTSPHGEVTDCYRWRRSSPDEADSKMEVVVTTLLTLCFYFPLVLVAFAMLAMLLAAYAKDRTTFQFSMACQATSSVLTQIGIVAFLLLYQSYVRWEDLTCWFYLCVGVLVELVLTTVLTGVSGKSLSSDWE